MEDLLIEKGAEVGKLRAKNELDLFNFSIDVVAEYPDAYEEIQTLTKKMGELTQDLEQYSKSEKAIQDELQATYKTVADKNNQIRDLSQ